jgi:hypothetical protein
VVVSTEKAELLGGLDVVGHDDVVGDVEPIDGGLPVEEQVEVARVAQGQHHHPVLGHPSRLLSPVLLCLLMLFFSIFE